MKNKVYAVRNGRNTGIFYDWETTRMQVDKYPNASFKSFISLSEAENWLGYKCENLEIKENNMNNEVPFEVTCVYKNYQEFLRENKKFLKESKEKKIKNRKTKVNPIKIKKEKRDKFEAYICGRYNYKTKSCKYCFVILKNNEQIDYVEGEYKDKDFDIYNDILGDIKATEKIFEYIIENKIENIIINYRYYNIVKWYKHEYKAKANTIKQFVNNCEKIYRENKTIKFKEASDFVLLKDLELKCM